MVEHLERLLPELPSQTTHRIQSKYNLPPKTCEILLAIGSETVENLMNVGCGVRYFEAVMAAAASDMNSKHVADW